MHRERESWAGLLGTNTVVAWILYGTYTLSIKDPKGGPGLRDTGKLVEVWKKQADGKWKCIVDTYNSDRPLPQ